MLKINSLELKQYFVKWFDDGTNYYIKMIDKGKNKLELSFTTPYDDLSEKTINVVFNYNNISNYRMNKNIEICTIKDCDEFLFDLFEYERSCISGYNNCLMYYDGLYNKEGE